MTFDQVLVFHKIVELGSFKSAAEQLHKTQPAISFAMKKLEQEMEAQLFDRSGYKPVLTDHGKAFYEKSFKLMQGMGELEALGQSFHNKEEPQINISIDGISPLPNLLKQFKVFSDVFPNTKLNLSFDILSETERKILSREAQLGITHFIHDASELEIVPITHVEMIPVMSTELFREKKVQSQKDLLEIDQVVVSDKARATTTSFGLLDGGKRWRLTDSNVKREIIMAGLGWGHLPKHTIHHELKLKQLEIIDFEDIHPRKLKINLIRLKKHSQGPVAKSLWESLTSLPE